MTQRALCLAVAILCISPQVSAEEAEGEETSDELNSGDWTSLFRAPRPYGPTASVLLGLNFCLPNAGGGANCEANDESFLPGFAFAGTFGWRLFPYLAATLDLDFGTISPPKGADDSAFFWDLGLMVGAKAMLPIGPWDAWIGLGVGWGRTSLSNGLDGGADVSVIGDGLALGFSLGAEYWLSDLIAVGMSSRFVQPFLSNICARAGDDRRCRSPETVDNPFFMALGVHATVCFLP